MNWTLFKKRIVIDCYTAVFGIFFFDNLPRFRSCALHPIEARRHNQIELGRHSRHELWSERPESANSRAIREDPARTSRLGFLSAFLPERKSELVKWVRTRLSHQKWIHTFYNYSSIQCLDFFQNGSVIRIGPIVNFFMPVHGITISLNINDVLYDLNVEPDTFNLIYLWTYLWGFLT